MVKMIFLAVDPGGTDAVAPVILKTIEKIDVKVFGKSESVKRFYRYGIEASNLDEVLEYISIKTLQSLIRDIKPECIITGTSGNDFSEKYMWTAAHNEGISVYAILDNWVNYGIRFSKYRLCEIDKYRKNKEFKYFPDIIFVMDENAKKEMIEEGIPERYICVSGQPHFQYVHNKIQSVEEAEVSLYKINLGCNKKTKVIVFAPDNIYNGYGSSENNTLGYDEREIFMILANILKSEIYKNIDFIVVIRPHPKDDSAFWSYIVSKDYGFPIRIDYNTNSQIIIRSSDMVIGMFSMFLLEAFIADKQILSVQIGLKGANPFILSRLGISRSVLDEKSLGSKMRRFLLEGDNDHTKSRDIFTKTAVENIFEVIIERGKNDNWE